MVLLLWFSVGGIKGVKAYEAVEGFQGATMKGRIVFKGKVPKSEKREVRRDAKFCGETIEFVPMKVNPDSHGVSNVVVSVEGVTTGKTILRNQAAPLLNKSCRFEPHTQVAVANSTLEISSVDPVLHNTHLRMNEKTFLNIALPPQGRVIKKPLKRPGWLEVQCDAHKFMRSTIHVFSHPYFTLTDDNGNFEISDVPPGQYKLTLWHEVVGSVHQTVIVPDSGEIALTIDLNQSH